MSDLTISDVSVAINEAFEKWAPKIIDECTKNNQLFQAQCDAHRIFKDKENVKDFYNTKDDLEQHIEKHKTNEIKADKRQGIIVKVLTSSVIMQAVYTFFQWKHK